MKLTKENVSKIKVGDMVKFTYPDKTTREGRVYGTPADGSWGILCSTSDDGHFGLGLSLFTGEIEFEIIQ